MVHHQIVQGLIRQPSLLFLVGAFAVLMALMIPAYFYVYRPKLNSTEWIGRLDRRSFQPLTAGALNLADIVWGLLSMLCAAFLWLVYIILWRKVLLQDGPFGFILRHLRSAIPIMLIAIALYLLIRLMYGKPLPAILCAILGSITVLNQPKALAMFTVSLLFLYLWACTPYDKPLFFNAIWLALSVAAYGLALLYSFPLIWAAPFYAGVYIAVQVLRWKHGNPERRGKKLAASILLLLLLLAAGFIAVWLAYCVRHDMGSPIILLRSFSFYRRLIPAMLSRFATLTHRSSYWDALKFSDSFCFITGVIALVPLLHGLIKLRDSRCLFLVLLLPCLLLAWYFSACYALIPVFAMIIGWCWSLFVQRGRPLFAVGFAATYLLFLFAELFIH